MNLTRFAFLIISLAAIGGASYASLNAVGGESRDLDRSVRLGSGGGAFLTTRVK